MNRRERVEKLIAALLDELPQHRDQADKVPGDAASRRRLLRALMNVRPPGPLDDEFLALQDELLSAETEERGVVDGSSLPATSDPRIVLWQGDITRLKVDAIVNAANAALRGCFVPNHACIDNDQLASCYWSCLQLAEEYNLGSIAFCCISTGVFRFPNDVAAEIAVRTVREFLRRDTSSKKVVCDVFRDEDFELYRSLLGA